MQYLIWIGAGLTMLGVLGLLWCIKMAVGAKRQGLSEEAIRAVMQRVVIWNMAALAVSGLGLMMVVFGVFVA